MLSQNEIIVDKLREYINKNAKFEVIGRSFGYYPSLISNKENTFLFECSGSQIEPYDVYLNLRDYYSIRTSCSCPYSGPGICKHEVASIEKLVSLIERETVDMSPIIEKKKFISPITAIPHENGII